MTIAAFIADLKHRYEAGTITSAAAERELYAAQRELLKATQFYAGVNDATRLRIAAARGRGTPGPAGSGVVGANQPGTPDKGR